MHRARRGPAWRWPLVTGAVGMVLGALAIMSSSRGTDPEAADAARTVVPLSLPGAGAAASDDVANDDMAVAPGQAESAPQTRAAVPVLAAASPPSEAIASSPVAAAGDRRSDPAQSLAAVDAW